ncbi:MAG: hypothetical protein PHT92_07285 [Bacteroidales bacterium]|nr:hypothetical protein [Bacteroidales bacterium]MDY0253855.1 hypothetical protein [Tenuifilaceae bacterium]
MRKLSTTYRKAILINTVISSTEIIVRKCSHTLKWDIEHTG